MRPAGQPNTDVRMRGFAQRTTVEAALAWLDSVLPESVDLNTEEVSVLSAAGRVLARDLISRVNIPGFARAMMDGFAVIAEDTQGATSYNPQPLKVLGASLPSQPFSETVARGSAVRIMTGAPMPNGADAVLPIEHTQLDGKRVLVVGEVSPGKHIGQIGEDVRSGDVVAWAGRVLRPQDIGMLSALGESRATVVRRPRVRILITGNELLPMGTPPSGYKITDANGPMLATLVSRDGGEPIMPPILPDDREAILAALREEADVVLVSGGSSVGQEDHVPTLLAEHGELAIHGIAMRPSSPTGLGRLTSKVSGTFSRRNDVSSACSAEKIPDTFQTLVFLLPGNPVSCLCAYDFFAGRAIRALGGRPRDWPYRRVRLRLSSKLASVVGRVDYARVYVDGTMAEPLAISGASILSSVTRADGFVIVPADSEGFPERAEVEVFLYE